MKSDERWLKEQVAKVQPSLVSEEIRAEALRQALTAMPGGRRQGHFRIPWLVGFLVPAAACAIGLLAVWWKPSVHERKPEQPIAMVSHRWIAEIAAMFPGQLDAVIADGEDVELKLRDTPADLPTDQGVEVEIVHAGKKCRMFTFSGRLICLTFEGQSLCVMPLLQGDGSVIVLANDQLAFPAGSETAENVRVSARSNPGFSS